MDLLDLGLETVTLGLDLWISLSTAVTLPKFCLKTLGFIPRHWLHCLCAGVTLNLREVHFAIRFELKSIECLFGTGNVIPWLPMFKSPKNGNSKLTKIVSLLVRPFFFKLLFYALG